VELRPELADVWLAFADLSAQRRCGMAGPDPLAAADIAAALDVLQVPRGERLVWWQEIKALDAEWLAWARDGAGKGRRGG